LISGGGENPANHPNTWLTVKNVVVDAVRRGSTLLELRNVTVTNEIFGGGIDPRLMIFHNSTLCGVYFEEISFFGLNGSSAPNPCPVSFNLSR
jgi:hypothetical protein